MTDTTSETITQERHGDVIVLSLNRPDVLNALDQSILAALGQRIAEVGMDESVRALVLTGTGRAFAAGADIAQMKSLCPTEAEEFSRLGHTVFGALESLPMPTIAAVNGFALGGGCELALSCDWIYAANDARFGQPEVLLGLIPGFGGTSRLVRRVGIAWAKELVLSGQNIKADQALSIGLANRLFEPDQLVAKSVEFAQKIAKAGPVAVSLAKRVMQEGQDADVRVAHSLEQNAFGLIFSTEDHETGIAAFLEKGEADFKGR